MLEENWCGNFSKPLAVFNKAFIRRLGKGLHPYIQLEGSEKDCAYCIDMEARLFYDNGLYESDEVLPFKPYSENIIVLSLIGRVAITPGCRMPER